MKIKEFTDILQEELELEDVELTQETRFDSLEDWDSMAIIILISFVDEKFNKQLTADDFNSIPTVQSLMETIGMDHFED